jgi:N-acetyl-anhydromuramyl-L-alanine amidase AmpD
MDEYAQSCIMLATRRLQPVSGGLAALLKGVARAVTDNETPQANALFEPVTQTWVRGPFADWYRRYGLDVTGYPLTEQYVDPETGLFTQYFQRVALEEIGGQIRLRLAGQESLLSQHELAQARGEVERLGAEAARLSTQLEQLRLEIAVGSQRAAVESERSSQPIIAALQAQLRQREEELAEAQLNLARMEREMETRDRRLAELEGQASQQSTTLAAQQAEIARLRAQLQQGGGSTPASGVTKPAMRDVVDQLQKHPTKSYPTRQLKAITHICIHHSAVAGTVPVEHVAKYHVESQDWPGIGYHYYVKPDGTIYQTQRLETVSYHVNHNNHYSLGICVSGNFTYAPPPQIQIDAAAQLTAWLMQELKILEKNILGHKEFPDNDTSCPGETWLKRMVWKNLLLDSVRAVRAGSQPNLQLKPLHHYILFWQKPDTWAQQDWQAADQYFGRFRPTAGFSLDDAKHAQFVTIVGGDAGVSYEAEQILRAAGSQVERIAGVDYADTKRILDQLAASGQRFLSFSS